MPDNHPIPSLSFVVPCYNEEPVLDELLRQLSQLGQRLHDEGRISSRPVITLVDDGSSDSTWAMIRQATERLPVQGVRLSRNHGHQAALLAGLMTSKADVVISLDADLQDDLAAVPKMLDAYRDGAEIVFGVRDKRDSDSFFKRWSARGYYALLRYLGVEIVPDHADFRLMSRKALETLRGYSEVNLFLRGLIRSIGYPSAIVTYERKPRLAGESKYPLHRMIALALEGVTSFSVMPLRYITLLGFLIALLSFGYIVYAVFGWILGLTVLGWASIVVSIFLLGGVQLVALGIIGEYLGKVYLETKRRPQFIIDTVIGPDRNDEPSA